MAVCGHPPVSTPRIRSAGSACTRTRKSASSRVYISFVITAIEICRDSARHNASVNLAAIEDLKKAFPDLDLILIESGGDNLAATFSPELVDLTIYIIDVCMGADIPRKKGPALLKSDMLVVNKIELAPHVDVDLDQMRADTAAGRGTRPFIFGSMRKQAGIDALVSFLQEAGGLSLDGRPSA